ncbi:MAG: ATP-binding protein [Gammaproteobacteria bacterium]
MRHNLYSINALVLTGFLLVALPLVVALWTTHTRMGELATTTTDAFERGVQAARDTQLLMEQMPQFERNVRQYRVVPDPTYRAVARERHQRLLELLTNLEAQLGRPSEEAAALRTRLATTVAQLDSAPETFDLDAFGPMHAAALTLANEVNSLVDAAVVDALQSVADTRRSLILRASALVPLALGFGILFALLITRPIRGLGAAIRQLGSGDLGEPVRVRGAADVETLGRHLDWLRVQLAEVETEKARFLRHVSHELKTPLANIREGSELLLDGSTGALTDAQSEVATILRDNGVTLQKSIENLLNYNAWQDKGTRVVRTLTDMDTMVSRVFASHRLALQREQLEAVAEIESDKLWVDGEKVEILIDNLVSNAIKFSPQGGTIRVSVRGRKRDAVIDVRDDGPGVPPEEAHRVFDAFFQGSRPQRGHVKGTGIGLSVVRESARMHGGNAEIVKGEHDGGHFRVTLANARDR